MAAKTKAVKRAGIRAPRVDWDAVHERLYPTSNAPDPLGLRGRQATLLIKHNGLAVGDYITVVGSCSGCCSHRPEAGRFIHVRSDDGKELNHLLETEVVFLIKEVWNSGTERWEDERTGRPTRQAPEPEPTVEALQRVGIISSDPNHVVPIGGSSPALRIACPVCKEPAGAYCRRPDGTNQIIAHKKRREAEEASRGE